MILPLQVLGLLISEIAEDNDIFLVDELIAYLDSVDGFIDMTIKEIDGE